MDKSNRLGAGIHQKDDLLAGFTFEDIIITLQSNEATIDEKAVFKVAQELLGERMKDFNFLLEQNVPEIIKYAKG